MTCRRKQLALDFSNAYLFDIPLMQVNALMSLISAVSTHRRGTRKAILCRPQTHQLREGHERGLRRKADWSAIDTKQVDCHGELTRSTQMDHFCLMYIHEEASSFALSMHLGFLTLHSLELLNRNSSRYQDYVFFSKGNYNFKLCNWS